MLRKVLITALAAAFAVAPAAAQSPVRRDLMAGVTYERVVEFTLHGPVVMHVLSAPRPGGLLELRPVLSNGALAGTEKLTDLQRRASQTATVAGVNGDYFGADGRPAGVLLRDGVLEHTPLGGRSSVGIDSTGALRVDRVQLFGTWQGSGQRRVVAGVNEPPGANGITLFTPAWGAATPAANGTVAAVLAPFPAAAPNTNLTGTVAQIGPGSAQIPPDGAVLVARGQAAARLQAEAPQGQSVTIRLLLKPEWAGVVHGLGGGPALVRGGKAVFRAKEAFPADLLTPRRSRTAVGQTADGRILLVAVDGGRPGYSTGVSNFELAQAMVRLGAATAAALGAGEESTMAFEGQLLSSPSAGEKPISVALTLAYAGVHAPPPLQPVLSPNGDGVAERQSLAYKVVRASTVTATLVGPDGNARYTDSGAKAPGVYRLDWSGRTRAGVPEPQGRWRWTVTATDDRGQASSVTRIFTLNNTLRGLRPVPPTLTAPRLKPRAVARLTLASPALVAPTVETETGIVLRTFPPRRLPAGPVVVAWNGRDGAGELVRTGRYVLRVRATNAFGEAELETRVRVRRVVPRPVRFRR